MSLSLEGIISGGIFKQGSTTGTSLENRETFKKNAICFLCNCFARKGVDLIEGLLMLHDIWYISTLMSLDLLTESTASKEGYSLRDDKIAKNETF